MWTARRRAVVVATATRPSGSASFHHTNKSLLNAIAHRSLTLRRLSRLLASHELFYTTCAASRVSLALLNLQPPPLTTVLRTVPPMAKPSLVRR